MHRFLKHKLSWAGLLVAAILLVWLSDSLPYRLDLTNEQRHTLSPAVKNLLKDLDEPVFVALLLKSDELPSGFKKLAQSTAQFLENASDISGGKLQWVAQTPDEFMADTLHFPVPDSLKSAFLKSQAVKQTEITSSGSRAIFNYPVALVKRGDAFTPVNLLSGQGQTGFMNPSATDLQFEAINNAEGQMEYLFASAIRQLAQTAPPIVAYATGHGEPLGPETYDLSSAIQDRYRFFLLNLKNEPFISDSIKALIVAKPRERFDDAEKLKMDQYLMRGGRILFLLDVLHADMDSLVRSGKSFTAYPRDINLEDILFKYGARVNLNLVQDLQSDMLPQKVGMAGDQPQIELLPWPYFPVLYPSSNHPIVKSLDAVVMQFPNGVDTVAAPGITKEILLRSSNSSRLVGTPAIVDVDILKKTDEASMWKQAGVPLALLLEGSFSSLYANRLGKAAMDTMAAYGVPFQRASVRPGKVIVTGDGDWVFNGFTREGPLEMGTNPYTKYRFANKNLLLNMLDYCTDETGIMAARGKSFVLRRLDAKKLEADRSTWQWINIALPVLLVLAAWALYGYLRQRKNTR